MPVISAAAAGASTAHAPITAAIVVSARTCGALRDRPRKAPCAVPVAACALPAWCSLRPIRRVISRIRLRRSSTLAGPGSKRGSRREGSGLHRRRRQRGHPPRGAPRPGAGHGGRARAGPLRRPQPCRRGAARRPLSGAAREPDATSRASRSSGTVEACGERVNGVAARRPRLRPRRRRRPGRPRRRARALRRARCPSALDEARPPPCPRRSSRRTTPSRSQAGLRPGETLLVHGAAGGVGTAAVQIGVVAGARVLGGVRSAEARRARRELGAEPIQDDGFADAVLASHRRARGGRDARARRRAALPRQPRGDRAEGPDRDRRCRRRPGGRRCRCSRSWRGA